MGLDVTHIFLGYRRPRGDVGMFTDPTTLIFVR